MRILGISAHYHDSAAALLVDGVPVCAVQEERLSRHKNDASFPVGAIDGRGILGQMLQTRRPVRGRSSGAWITPGSSPATSTRSCSTSAAC